MATKEQDLVQVQVTRQTRAKIKAYASKRGLKVPPAAAELVEHGVKRANEKAGE